MGHNPACFATLMEPARVPISPLLETGAYEALWLTNKASFKSIARLFSDHPDALPSDFIEQPKAEQCAAEVREKLEKSGVCHFGICVHHAGDYPAKLRDARYPVEFLYYRGAWELTKKRCIAVVGSRKASNEGCRRAKQLVKALVKRDFTIVSGLAAGIDTVAHTTALDLGGTTIAVVGTPLGQVYPKENQRLQERIAKEHLLISQVPILRYSRQNPKYNRLFFLERNITMSVLSEAIVIVEAGETSGALKHLKHLGGKQAAFMQKGRKIFILNSCFQQPDITWPTRLVEKQGAIRIAEPDNIWEILD